MKLHVFLEYPFSENTLCYFKKPLKDVCTMYVVCTVKACYFMKDGIVDLSTYGGKIEFLEIKIQIQIYIPAIISP